MGHNNNFNRDNDKTNIDQTIISNIIKTSEVAVISKDLDGVIRSWNKGAEKLYGYSKKDAIGKSISIIFPENKLNDIPKILNKIKKGESIENIETLRKTKAGDLTSISLTISPIYNEDKQIIGASAIGYNITKIKNAEKELINKEKEWKKSFDSIEDIMLILSKEYTIQKINKKGLDFLSKKPEEVIGKKCFRVFYGFNKPAKFCPSSKILSSNKSESSDEVVKISDRYFSIKCSPIFNNQGKIVKFIDLMRDVSDQKMAEKKIRDSLKEKEILLKEIHHRVKNNLQIISTLLEFQSNDIDDAKTLNKFIESQNRIQSISLVHEKLYHSDNLAEIDFKEYLENLIIDLFHSIGVDIRKIKYEINCLDIHLNINEAIPCGLILSELITNSLKHAFPEDLTGKIYISMKREEKSGYSLLYRDNGIGLDRDFNLENSDSLGFKIVNSLVKQLNGKMQYCNKNGLSFEIKFKEKI